MNRKNPLRFNCLDTNAKLTNCLIRTVVNTAVFWFGVRCKEDTYTRRP